MPNRMAPNTALNFVLVGLSLLTLDASTSHLESVAVVGFRAHTMWEGMVEIFALKGHAKAKRAYDWQTGHGTDAQFTAVLAIPPVDSPNTAVRAAIAAKARQNP